MLLTFSISLLRGLGIREWHCVLHGPRERSVHIQTIGNRERSPNFASRGTDLGERESLPQGIRTGTRSISGVA